MKQHMAEDCGQLRIVVPERASASVLRTQRPMLPNCEVVYVVDDESSVRESLGELLCAVGIEHVGFRSAPEYLSYERNDTCACLVLGLQLPGVSGLEVQAQLASRANPPIIFVSGYCDISSAVRAMKAGATEVLTKPVDPQVLVSAIMTAFAKDREARRKDAALASLEQRLSRLTPREREVFPLIADGMLNKQAAAVLGITEVTLQVHRGQIMKKMEAGSFADLVRMAGKLNIPPGSLL